MSVAAGDATSISKYALQSKGVNGFVEQSRTNFMNGANSWNNENQVVCNSGVPHVHLQKDNAYALDVSETFEEILMTEFL